MIVGNQFFVIFFMFCISFLFIRGFLSGVKSYQLNKSALKKRRKDESFKERMLYSKFRKEIPKSLLVLYFSILIIHPVAFIICVLLYFIDIYISFIAGEIIAKVVYYSDFAWMLLLGLLFWSPGQDFAYERWITKKRGQNRKKK